MQAERDRIVDKSDRLARQLNETEEQATVARKRISEQLTEIETLKARLAAKSEKSP